MLTRLKVGPHVYAVAVVPDLELEGESCQATHNAARLAIDVHPGVVGLPSLLADNFLHEGIHALCALYLLNPTEREVTVLATGLLALLVDNPDLRELIEAAAQEQP